MLCRFEQPRLTFRALCKAAKSKGENGEIRGLNLWNREKTGRIVSDKLRVSTGRDILVVLSQQYNTGGDFMKKFVGIVMSLVLFATIGCVGALAAGEVARVESETAQVGAKALFSFVRSDGVEVYSYEVPNATKVKNSITLEYFEGDILSVSASVGEMINLVIEGGRASFVWTYARAEEVKFEITVSETSAAEAVTTPLAVSYSEALKLLALGGVRVDGGVEVTGVEVQCEADTVELVEGAYGFTGELSGKLGDGELVLRFSSGGGSGSVRLPLAAVSTVNADGGVSFGSGGAVCLVEFRSGGETVALRAVRRGEALGTLPEVDGGWANGNILVDATTEIRRDTVLTASENAVTGHAGSVARVSNADGELLALIEERCGEVDVDSVKIRLDGLYFIGNEGYTDNGWTANRSWYVIANCTSSGESSEYENTHIPADELKGITVFATAYGREVSFKLTVDELEISADGEDMDISVATSPTVELLRGSGAAYMEGRSESEFAPEQKITRAEAVTLIYRCLTPESRESLTERAYYADVTRGAWYYEPVSILSGAELIDGEAGYFRPDEAITRGDFITLAVKAYGAEEYYGVDYFNDTTHTPWRGYINAAARLGLVTGYPDGGFHPYSSLTRAEAVTIINGLLHRNSS